MMKNLDISKIKGLIFDLDGTLADTMPLHLEAFNQEAKKIGLVLTQENHQRYAGMPTLTTVELLAKEQNIDIDAVAFTNEKERIFLEEKLPTVKPIVEVMAFVTELKGKYPVAVGTGGTRDIANQTLQYIGMEAYQSLTITANDVQNHKPAPDTFIEAAKLINIAPENCLVFEDAILGIEAANAGNMQAINILNHTKEELECLLQKLQEK